MQDNETKQTITTREFAGLSDEMLYGYILATLDMGYVPTFHWHNIYRENVHGTTFETTVDPDELEYPEYTDQVKARNYGWLTPQKIQYMSLEPKGTDQ